MSEAVGPSAVERRIGVAVSGGGYRAAAWGLGTLLYLADAELNDQVVTVSSVSGGSITNAALGLQPYRSIGAAKMRAFAASTAPLLAANLRPFLGLLLPHLGAWATMVVAAGLHSFAVASIALAAAVALSLVLAHRVRRRRLPPPPDLALLRPAPRFGVPVDLRGG